MLEDEDSDKQPRVFLDGGNTKTSTDRNRYITKELATMLRLCKTERYETGHTYNGQSLRFDKNDLVFALRS